jgi:hypothetical protein
MLIGVSLCLIFSLLKSSTWQVCEDRRLAMCISVISYNKLLLFCYFVVIFINYERKINIFFAFIQVMSNDYNFKKNIKCVLFCQNSVQSI